MKSEFDRLLPAQPLFKSLYETCKEKLGFKPDAKIVILKNEENSNNPLGKTAYYDPSTHKIGLYTQGRHVKDIMRSLSHELVHHAQNCRGDFDKGIATVEGYAQEDGHLREMEREAYETGNLLFRDWEDNYKRNDNTKLFNNTTTMGEKLMEDRVNEEADRVLVDEIVLTMTNDGDFYRQTIQPWIKNFRQKIKRGAFNEAAALKAFERYVTKDALKKYSIDQAGDVNYWKQIGKEDRQAIAAALLNHYMEEIEYIEEQKIMENKKEIKLREAIRKLIKEMQVNIKEEGDSSFFSPEMIQATADQQQAADADAAALAAAGQGSDASAEEEMWASSSGDEGDEINEGTFFPVGRDVRNKARIQTHDALMKRWGYNKKND